MKNYGYIGTYSYSDKPISAWGYVGYSILWFIPVIGWLAWLCAALFSRNQNKKSYARSRVCGFLFLLLIVVIALGVIVLAHFMGWFNIFDIVKNLTGFDLAEMIKNLTGLDLNPAPAA